MKTVQDFIFGEEFQRNMDKAVTQAVARADAAGLPKARLDSYDALPQARQNLPQKDLNERKS